MQSKKPKTCICLDPKLYETSSGAYAGQSLSSNAEKDLGYDHQVNPRLRPDNEALIVSALKLANESNDAALIFINQLLEENKKLKSRLIEAGLLK